MRTINLIGQVFGKLTVLSQAANSKFHSARWNCLCVCGKTPTVDSHSLRRGSTKSCGACMRGFSDETLSSKNHLYLKYKLTCAGKRGLSFTLSFEEFIHIVQQNCFYCDSPPGNCVKSHSTKNGFFYNGLDRIDNNKGYDIDNVRPCCVDCNYAKGTQMSEEFIDWVKKCYNHLKANNMLIEEAK